MSSAALVVDVSGAVVVIVEISVVVDVSAALVVDISGAVVVIVEVSVVFVYVSGAVVVIVEVFCCCRCFCCTSGGCFRNSCCDFGGLCCCRCFLLQ